jgi:phosphoribosylformylglycinamidine (FGAM) synthase PurS component
MSAKNGNAYTVEVKLRNDYVEAEGQSALALLQSLGLNTARDCRTSKLYELRGGLNSAHAQQIGRDLLSDPVTQEFKLVSPSAAAVANGMNFWRVEVWLKASVSDPVGDTVRSAIAEMGLPQPESVRVGTAFLIAGKCHRGQLEKAVARGLANPVIHRVTVSETHP